MRYLQLLKWASALALSVGSAMASAATVTYDFAGFVGANIGSHPVPIFTPVTGSFTIDYDAAIPGQGSGQFNSPTGTWTVASNGLPSALVFSETATVGGTTYSTTTLSTYLNQSQVVGGNQQFTGESTLYADASDSFGLSFGAGYGVNYLSNGLPDLADAPLGGMIGTYSYRSTGSSQNDVAWTVTSLTLAPVPLPAAVWLLISGLGGLGALGRRSHLRRHNGT